MNNYQHATFYNAMVKQNARHSNKQLQSFLLFEYSLISREIEYKFSRWLTSQSYENFELTEEEIIDCCYIWLKVYQKKKSGSFLSYIEERLTPLFWNSEEAIDDKITMFNLLLSFLHLNEIKIDLRTFDYQRVLLPVTTTSP